MKQAIIICNDKNAINYVYAKEVLTSIHEKVNLYEEVLTKQDILHHLEITRKAEIIFSTWGMPHFTASEIEEYFPNLKIVFYAAGSVQHFAREFLNKGVKVVSSYAANAIPTAEFAACQIVLANKGFFQATHLVKNKSYWEGRKHTSTFPGNYNIKIGILGAGMVGSHVIKLLKAMNINAEILVFDPFLSEERSQELGVRKASLEEIFATCQTISNHLANNEQTQGVLNKKHFNLMLDNATFINTGRGQQVVEGDLIAALKEKPKRTAVLDVTYPEPPLPDSELYKLPNVILTPHMAGSSGNEVIRMAWYAVNELDKWLEDKPLSYEVTLKMLETMA